MPTRTMEIDDFNDLVQDYSSHVCDYCNGVGCGHCKNTGEEHWSEEDTIMQLQEDNYIEECPGCISEGCDACNEIGYLEVYYESNEKR